MTGWHTVAMPAQLRQNDAAVTRALKAARSAFSAMAAWMADAAVT